MPRIAVVPILLLLLVSCAAPAAAPGAREGSARGTVRVVGSSPVNVSVRIQGDGTSAEVRGPLTPEIRRLAGAEVEAWGMREGDLLHVERYRIRAVDGSPVRVGVVEAAPGGGLRLRTDEGELIALGGGIGSLRPGQKAWVQGVTAVRVQTYGVISP